jgi:hypothetical protein
MTTRVLFLDDSGKPDAKHPSGAVVIAGLAVPSALVPTLSRRVLGAKAKHLPSRGHPASWEIKSGSFIKPNPWKRSKNRNFVAELVRIVRDVGGTFYSVSLEKARMNHSMGLAQTMPLQLQALVEHFEVECRHHNETGVIVSDWSSHHADNHASACVASYVASRRLRIHPSIYYASSLTTEAIQVADLVAAIRRRCIEGDANLADIDAAMATTRTIASPTTLRTFRGRLYDNQIRLF